MADEPTLTDEELGEMVARHRLDPGSSAEEDVERLVAEVRRRRDETKRLESRLRLIDVTHHGSTRKELLCNTCGQIKDGGPFDQPALRRDETRQKY